MNRREGSRLSKDTDPDPDDIDVKEQAIEPKQNIKSIPTPRIKLKHKNISDDEFTIIMRHDEKVKKVSIFVFTTYLNHLYYYYFFNNKHHAYIFNSYLLKLCIYYLREHRQ